MIKAIIKYPGSKWRMAEWIISFFPEHHSYLEPFFGSGAVLFTKERSHIETVNDLDGEVVNLFEQIRRDPERLAREIYLTPYARAVYDRAFEEQGHLTDPMQRAVSFYVRSMMGHGYRTTGEKVGFKRDIGKRERAYAARYWGELPADIIEAAERLRGVQIECTPALKLLEGFNSSNVLVYADPPYVLGTRHGKQYRHEMTDQDHRDLLDVLKAHKGPVLISGYDSELYNETLAGWHREERNAIAQTSARRREVLWMNFEPDGQIRIKEAQYEPL